MTLGPTGWFALLPVVENSKRVIKRIDNMTNPLDVAVLIPERPALGLGE